MTTGSVVVPCSGDAYNTYLFIPKTTERHFPPIRLFLLIFIFLRTSPSSFARFQLQHPQVPTSSIMRWALNQSKTHFWNKIHVFSHPHICSRLAKETASESFHLGGGGGRGSVKSRMWLVVTAQILPNLIALYFCLFFIITSINTT